MEKVVMYAMMGFLVVLIIWATILTVINIKNRIEDMKWQREKREWERELERRRMNR